MSRRKMRVRSENPDENSTSKFRIICPPSSPVPPEMGIIPMRACCRASSVSIAWSLTSFPSISTVCSSMHPSPAALSGVPRVRLKCSGRSKLTHNRTRRSPSHLTPCGITLGSVICSCSNRWVPSSNSAKSRCPYACFARPIHAGEPSIRIRL